MTKPKLSEKTSREKHLVNPYQIVVANGRYYLIGNIGQIQQQHSFSRRKNFRRGDYRYVGKACQRGGRVSERTESAEAYGRACMYVFGQIDGLVRLRVSESGINDVIDWLGSDIQITRESKDTLLVDVTANPQAMKYWAVQFGEKVEILLPEALREEVRELVTKIYNKYER